MKSLNGISQALHVNNVNHKTRLRRAEAGYINRCDAIHHHCILVNGGFGSKWCIHRQLLKRKIPITNWKYMLQFHGLQLALFWKWKTIFWHSSGPWCLSFCCFDVVSIGDIDAYDLDGSIALQLGCRLGQGNFVFHLWRRNIDQTMAL